jgi:hypothetical protein
VYENKGLGCVLTETDLEGVELHFFLFFVACRAGNCFSQSSVRLGRRKLHLVLRTGFLLRLRLVACAEVSGRFWGRRCLRLVGRSSFKFSNCCSLFVRTTGRLREPAPRFGTSDCCYLYSMESTTVSMVRNAVSLGLDAQAVGDFGGYLFERSWQRRRRYGDCATFRQLANLLR